MWKGNNEVVTLFKSTMSSMMVGLVLPKLWGIMLHIGLSTVSQLLKESKLLRIISAAQLCAGRSYATHFNSLRAIWIVKNIRDKLQTQARWIAKGPVWKLQTFKAEKPLRIVDLASLPDEEWADRSKSRMAEQVTERKFVGIIIHRWQSLVHETIE